ncbi:FAD-binding oxidoreductase [Terrilactibacillus sp. S3-3]|nr:FAD-binding oxidoreductase [Terrilactibacillus sp. S3-3]
MQAQEKIKVVVEQVKKESPVVKRFKLVPEAGCKLPKFSGGSHITTFLTENKRPLERNYSLISPPDQSDAYEIAIRRNDQSSGVSVYWHTKIKEGEKLEISYPKNRFAIGHEAKHHVFFCCRNRNHPVSLDGYSTETKGPIV